MKGLFTVLSLCSLALLLSAKQGQDDPEQDASELIKDIMALRNAVRQTNTFVEEQTTALKMREGQQEESEAPEKLLAVTSEQEVTLKRDNDVIQHLLDTLRVCLLHDFFLFMFRKEITSILLGFILVVCVCVHACVRACPRARARVRACVCVCVCVCVCGE